MPKYILYQTTFKLNYKEGALLLDVIVGEGPAVLQLLLDLGEDQHLPVWGDTLLVPDLVLDILDGARGLLSSCLVIRNSHLGHLYNVLDLSFFGF